MQNTFAETVRGSNRTQYAYEFAIFECSQAHERYNEQDARMQL
jgi:hypothetical protein